MSRGITRRTRTDANGMTPGAPRRRGGVRPLQSPPLPKRPPWRQEPVPPARRRVEPRVGRPSLLNSTAQENITRALRTGSHLKQAVESFGIDYSTAARWMADGAAHADGRPSKAQRDRLGAKAQKLAEAPCVGLDEVLSSGELRRRCLSSQHEFREFREAVVRAKAEAVLIAVDRLQQASQSGSVAATLALLRSLAPEEWGETRRVRVEDSGHGGCGGPPLIIELYANDRDPKELAEIMESLEEGTAAR